MSAIPSGLNSHCRVEWAGRRPFGSGQTTRRAVSGAHRISRASNGLVGCLLAGLASLLPAALAFPALANSPRDTELHFRVLLDGKPIGEHRFEFRRDGDTNEVLSRAEFNLRLMFLELYRYQHTDTERWRDGCLVSLDSHTDDNGRIERVDARRHGQEFVVAASNRQIRYPGCVRSFAYWDPALLETDHLLNAQTGEYLPVRVQALGTERFAVEGREEVAERYRLTAKDLDVTLWYTRDRQWVALESRVGGRLLRYERR